MRIRGKDKLRLKTVYCLAVCKLRESRLKAGDSLGGKIDCELLVIIGAAKNDIGSLCSPADYLDLRAGGVEPFSIADGCICTNASSGRTRVNPKANFLHIEASNNIAKLVGLLVVVNKEYQLTRDVEAAAEQTGAKS